jgi:hypothetical protein
MNKTLNLLNTLNGNSNRSKPNSAWSTFDDNNSPYYNNGLSPLYYTETKTKYKPYFSRSGDSYAYTNGILSVNGKTLLTPNRTGFKKTKLSYDADTISFYQENIFYSKKINNTLSIHRVSNDTDEVIASRTFSNPILAERFINNLYLCLYIENKETILLSWYNDVFTETVIDFYKGDDKILEPEFVDPIITFSEVGENKYRVCLINKSGAWIDAFTLCTAFLLIDNGTITKYSNVKNKVTGTTESVEDIDMDIICKPTRTSQFLKSDCYKIGDKYYKDAEGTTQITFDEGYTPTKSTLGDNVYSYVLFQTIYTYKITTYGYSLEGDLNGKFSVDLSDASRIIRTPFVEIETLIDPYGTTTLTVTVDNNFGYITSNKALIPSLKLYYNNQIILIPNSWVEELYTFTVSDKKTYTISSAGLDGYLMLDDGYFYGYPDKWGIQPKKADYTQGTSTSYKKQINFKNTANFGEYSITIGNVLKENTMYDISTSYFTGCFLDIDKDYIKETVRLSYVPQDSDVTKKVDSSSTETIIKYDRKNNKKTTQIIVKTNDLETSNTTTEETVTFSFGLVVNENNKKYYDLFYTYDNGYDSLISGGLEGAGISVDNTRYVEGGTEGVDIYFNNLSNSSIKKNGLWRLLYNNGYLSGLSYAKDGEVGTLISGWNTGITDVEKWTDGYLAIKENGKWWLYQNNYYSDEYSIFNNRYIIINTSDYYNTYDMLEGKTVHWASDWNNRIMRGTNDYFKTFEEVYTEDPSTCYIASGENVIYNQSYDNIVSSLFAVTTLGYARGSDVLFLDSNNGSIDYFESDSTTPKYRYTHKNNTNEFNNKLVVNALTVSYPLSTTNTIYYYNIPLIYEAVYGQNNSIFIENGENISKLLNKNDGVNIITLASSSTSGNIPYLQNLFIIQTMPYAVIKDHIYSLEINNGVYSNLECIISTAGMTYLGSTTSTAYFWSPINRSIYTFTGDAILKQATTLSKIGNVYNHWYNPTTQTIYLGTDDGLYMLGSKNMYKQQFYNVVDVLFADDKTYIIDKPNDYITYCIAHEYFEGSKTNRVRLDTGLYGDISNNPYTIPRWSFKLFNNNHFGGVFKIKSYSLSDVGKIEKREKVFNIKTSDWDKDFDYILINYAPENNKGIGLGISLESDFLISEVIASTDNNTQQSRNNL